MHRLGFASGIGAMRTLQTAEVKHGRAAMMGITGFAVQVRVAAFRALLRPSAPFCDLLRPSAPFCDLLWPCS